MAKYTYSNELISDLHKDARGFRPREGFWQTWSDSSPQRKELIWKGLIAEMEEAETERLMIEQINLDKFRATLRGLIVEHQVDWVTALRWLMDAEDEPEMEYFLWKQGLSWAKNREIQRLYTESEQS